MQKYLLTEWQAIELFCEIIFKYENLRREIPSEDGNGQRPPIKMTDFQANNKILQALRWCENPEYYEPFSAIHLKNVAKKERISRNYTKSLYDLSLEIRLQLPIRAKSKIDQKPKVRRLLIN